MSDQLAPAWSEPPEVAPVAAELLPLAAKPSGGFKAVAIIAILLGALGLLTVAMSAASLLWGKQLQAAVAPMNQPGLKPEIRDAQAAMQADLQALQDRFRSATSILVAAHLVVALMLLVGGIQSLRLAAAGRTILLTGCGLAIGFDLAAFVVKAMMQLESTSLLARHMPRIMEASGNRLPPGATNMASATAQITIFVGIGISLIWLIAKLVYYAIAIRQLRKPEIRQLFASPFARPA